MPKAKILTMPALPGSARKQRQPTTDFRYVEGQRMVVEALKYLVQSDQEGNRDAIDLLSEHFRTRFRITDKAEVLQPQELPDQSGD